MGYVLSDLRGLSIWLLLARLGKLGFNSTNHQRIDVEDLYRLLVHLSIHRNLGNNYLSYTQGSCQEELSSID